MTFWCTLTVGHIWMIQSFPLWLLALKMNSRSGRVSRGQKSKTFQGEGPNWILIAGGALLSTLSIRLGYKLKQAFDTKQQDNATTSLKGMLVSIAPIICIDYIAASNFKVCYREWNFWQEEIIRLPFTLKHVFIYPSRWWLFQLHFRCDVAIL